MQIKVNVINITETPKTNKIGKPYQELEIIYKDDSGKANTKKLMSFNQPEVYKAFVKASAGSVLTVESQKQGEYWVWVEIVQAGSVSPSVGAVATTVTPVKATSNYESQEERAVKQRYIVRQSSLSNAIAALSVGSKTPHSSEEIIDLAKEFEAYVFSVESPKLLDVRDLSDMDSDIPY